MKNILILLMIFTSVSCFALPVDTIDYFTIRVKGKTISNTNEVAIGLGFPMKVNLSLFSDNDTLQICYWTDHGKQAENWELAFKDFNNNVLGIYENPIDSTSIKSRQILRKNYISFSISELKQLLSSRMLKVLLVFHKNFDMTICMIS